MIITITKFYFNFQFTFSLVEIYTIKGYKMCHYFLFFIISLQITSKIVYLQIVNSKTCLYLYVLQVMRTFGWNPTEGELQVYYSIIQDYTQRAQPVIILGTLEYIDNSRCIWTNWIALCVLKPLVQVVVYKQCCGMNYSR